MGSDLRDGRVVMGVLRSDNGLLHRMDRQGGGKNWEKKGEGSGSRSSITKRSLKSVVDLPQISHVMIWSCIACATSTCKLKTGRNRPQLQVFEVPLCLLTPNIIAPQFLSKQWDRP